MSNSDIETLEVEIDQAREVIRLNDELTKLLANPSFKKIIEVGYFEDEAIRLVALKMDLEFSSPEKQESIDRQMFGIGAVQAYLNKVRRAGNIAADAMAQMEEAQAELLEEGA
jgi:hypothetical protein